MAILQVNLGYPVFIEAKDDGGGGDNWSYKSCKAPVKSSPPTNQHPVFYRRMPFLSPNQQCQSTEGKISHSMNLLTPSSLGGLPTLSLTNNSSWLPWGGLPCLSSALWCQYPHHQDHQHNQYFYNTAQYCEAKITAPVYFLNSFTKIHLRGGYTGSYQDGWMHLQKVRVATNRMHLLPPDATAVAPTNTNITFVSPYYWATFLKPLTMLRTLPAAEFSTHLHPTNSITALKNNHSRISSRLFHLLLENNWSQKHYWLETFSQNTQSKTQSLLKQHTSTHTHSFNCRFWVDLH